MKRIFFKYLTLFFYRRWMACLIPGEKKPVGIPGNRDPEAICEAYAPLKKGGEFAFTDCETDGHYLCSKCIHNIKNNT